METILYFISAMLFIALTLQSFRITKIKKTHSFDVDWYSNDISRFLKEGSINELRYAFDKHNLNIVSVLQYLSENKHLYEDLVEVMISKMPLTNLYLPKKLEQILVVDSVEHYPYRIGKTLKVKQLLSGLNGSTHSFAYHVENICYRDLFSKILNSNTLLHDSSFCDTYYFLASKYGKLYYCDVKNYFHLPKNQWQIRGLVPIDKISDHGLDDFFDKGDILILPKMIE